jgi:hypothetical protein
MMLVVVFKFDYDHKVTQGFEQLYQNDEDEDSFVSWDVKLYKRIERFLEKNGFLEVVDVPQQQNDEDLESNSALNQEDQQELSKQSEEEKEVPQEEVQISKEVQEEEEVPKETKDVTNE